MDARELTPVDLASAAKLDPKTVSNYLEGRRCHRNTKIAIERGVNFLKRLYPAPGKQAVS